MKVRDIKSTIDKTKVGIRDHIFSRDRSDIEDYNRLLKMDGGSFFCYLAAIHMSSIYQLIVNNWLFKELSGCEEFYSDVVYSRGLLDNLLPILNTKELSILPGNKNFQKFFNL